MALAYLTLGERRFYTSSGTWPKPEPDGLWHAVIFYTAGRAVVDEATRRGEGYTMIADAVDVYTHEWAPYHDALVEHWQPYLEGRGSLAASLKAVVAAASR